MAVPTVLVVDDNPDLVQLLTDILRELGGYEVAVAENGMQGLERYEEVHPDCVIIDVMMPELDGYQVVKALRGDPASAQTPLVILTALGQDVSRLNGLIAGADRYLVKPVIPSDLIQVIHEVMQLSEAEREGYLQQLAKQLDA